MLETLTKEHWAEHLNRTFRLDSGKEQPFEVRLVEVHSLGNARNEQREPFSLLFQAPQEPLLDQGIYTLHNSKLGTMELFLVPLGPKGDGLCYEAVFT
ncbi:MAG: hypothetical protein HC808_06905 [Candidatus Competibacteraceae bacterium]|nr:hypothetical protein [Candidatus Competibacteraceae bacterium]